MGRRWWISLKDAPEGMGSGIADADGRWTDSRGRTRVPLDARVLLRGRARLHRESLDLRIAESRAVAGGDMARAKGLRRQRVRLGRWDDLHDLYERTIRRLKGWAHR